MLEDSGKRSLLAALYQHSADEVHAVGIRKEHGLAQVDGRFGVHRRGAFVEHRGLHRVDQIRSALHALARGGELVVEEDDHGLSFDDGLASGTLLIEDHLRGIVLGIFAYIQPFFETEALVLQSMDEFVGHHRLLNLGFNPVEEIDGFTVRVIPSLDLLLVETEHVLA